MPEPSSLPVRKPTRLAGFDYTTCGMYFVTICVQSMEPRFGVLKDDGVRLNDAGMMIASQWQANALRYPGVALDAVVVMPDHMHAIVFLGAEPDVPGQGVSLSRVVQSFKSLTTVDYTRGVRAGKYPSFDRALWQRGFYDKILRNDNALNAARLYIDGNPSRAQERLRKSTPV